MRTYASPRPGYCASCEGVISGRPVYRMDQAYCCLGCASGELCICTYEADLADDGVDRLGLLFSVSHDVPAEPVRDAAVAQSATAPVRKEAAAAEREPELVR